MRGARRKKTLLFFTVLALIVLCVLVALRAASQISLPAAIPSAPALAPAAAETGAPEDLPEPEAAPHQHEFDPETGVCSLCGFACPHEDGFDAEHRCLVCRWQCRNQSHDPETACCPVCGEAFCHHFGMDGICDVCGAEAPLELGMLPDRYFEPSEHEGSCSHSYITAPGGAAYEISVWLPWDYSEDLRYNVVILLHGDHGKAADWTDEPEPTERGDIEFRRVYDRMVEERLCEPFLIVGLENRGFMYPSDGERFLRQELLPYIATHYSTFLGSGSEEELLEAREHVAFGGLSRGSMYTYSCVMPRCVDVVGNFCCFSNGDNNRIAAQLNEQSKLEYPILSYVASYGSRDDELTVSIHQKIYRTVCGDVERVTDGVNARMFVIDSGHDFITWTTSLYDALLLMF